MKLDQTGLVVAILAEIGRQYPGKIALPRQLNAVIDAADMVVTAFIRGEIKAEAGIGIAAWRKTDQVGMSSDYMAAVLGPAGERPYAHPHDPSDFHRCLTLLQAAPELRERLPQMARKSQEWAALVAHWEELETLFYEEEPTGRCPKLYERMKMLLSQAAVSRFV